MARIKKHKDDKFYTKERVAIDLISKIDLSKYDCVIEPSAGNGSFSRNIKHKNLISLDIEPEDDISIIKMDWFDFKYDKPGRFIVIGNPPFGNQGSLAMRFIKKCDELGADTIAFILPKSFKKNSTKNKIPDTYKLSLEFDIPEDSFTLMDKDYSVPSIFQVWERLPLGEKREKVELRKTSEFINFVKKTENPDYSFRRVGFNAGSVYDDITEKSEQSHYFIKSDDIVKDLLKNYKWEHNNTAGPRSIGKSEIIEVIEKYLK
jgi:hypothetical protein